MSKVVADAIEHSTAGSLTTDYVVKGSAKAWANLDGTGTIALRDSFNITSVTDNSTGSCNFSFSDSMSNNNYSITTGVGDIGTANITAAIEYNGANHSISSSNFNVYTRGSANTADDADYLIAAIHGDLA